jgi:hypothetical protein
MDHDTAAQMKAPERYVLGDLSPGERDEFEDHFAGCTSCMDEVWTASAFAANARAVFRERAATEAAPRKSEGWLAYFRWQFAVPTLAAVALAVLAMYQSTVTIPSLRAPRAFGAAVILDGATRASLPQVPAGSPAHFQMGLAGTATAQQGWAELTTDSGRVISAGPVVLPRAGEPLDIYFPVRLQPGRYSIVIRAGQTGGGELAHNGFQVTAQEASTHER